MNSIIPEGVMPKNVRDKVVQNIKSSIQAKINASKQKAENRPVAQPAALAPTPVSTPSPQATATGASSAPVAAPVAAAAAATPVAHVPASAASVDAAKAQVLAEIDWEKFLPDFSKMIPEGVIPKNVEAKLVQQAEQATQAVPLDPAKAQVLAEDWEKFLPNMNSIIPDGVMPKDVRDKVVQNIKSSIQAQIEASKKKAEKAAQLASSADSYHASAAAAPAGPAPSSTAPAGLPAAPTSRPTKKSPPCLQRKAHELENKAVLTPQPHEMLKIVLEQTGGQRMATRISEELLPDLAEETRISEELLPDSFSWRDVSWQHVKWVNAVAERVDGLFGNTTTTDAGVGELFSPIYFGSRVMEMRVSSCLERFVRRESFVHGETSGGPDCHYSDHSFISFGRAWFEYLRPYIA